MKRIYLLRHGQTEWNVAGKIQGRLDSPLTTHGRNRTKQWSIFLHNFSINKIISSPQQRAIDTANIIAKKLGLNVTNNSGLREQDWGDWEGFKRTEIDQVELDNRIKLGWDFSAPNGETRKAVLERIITVLLQTKYDNSLIICHQGVIKALIYHVANRKFLPNEEKLIAKDEMQCIVLDNGQLKIKELNITLP
ncbi:MAG: histidine phosphatase family protein [Desulfotalea sp.]